MDVRLACFTYILSLISSRMNEDKQLKKRYVKFNPTELQRVAGQAMGEEHCPFIVKLAEGGFNRVFLLGTNSGKEVIARIFKGVCRYRFHYKITASVLFLHGSSGTAIEMKLRSIVVPVSWL